MKVAVIGAGSMGSLYGGFLAKENHDVYLIDVFESHVNAINQKGLCIIEDGKEMYIKNIKATTEASEVGIVDLAIVFVKSTITDTAVRQNREIFGENTIVLTLQNGLGNIEKINTVVDLKQIIAGTSANGANIVEPGKINHAGNGDTVIGEIDGILSSRIKGLRDLLNIPRLGPCVVSNNVMGLLWDKLLVNVGINPITALTGLKNGELLEHKESMNLLEAAVNEGINVANALGIKLGFTDAQHCKDVARGTGNNISSMLSDIKNKRKTEILNINGAIVREGAKHNILTPINETLTNLILLKEKNFKSLRDGNVS